MTISMLMFTQKTKMVTLLLVSAMKPLINYEAKLIIIWKMFKAGKWRNNQSFNNSVKHHLASHKAPDFNLIFNSGMYLNNNYNSRDNNNTLLGNNKFNNNRVRKEDKETGSHNNRIMKEDKETGNISKLDKIKDKENNSNMARIVDNKEIGSNNNTAKIEDKETGNNNNMVKIEDTETGKINNMVKIEDMEKINIKNNTLFQDKQIKNVVLVHKIPNRRVRKFKTQKTLDQQQQCLINMMRNSGEWKRIWRGWGKIWSNS